VGQAMMRIDPENCIEMANGLFKVAKSQMHPAEAKESSQAITLPLNRASVDRGRLTE
jgi:hypothetical protein